MYINFKISRLLYINNKYRFSIISFAKVAIFDTVLDKELKLNL